MEILFILAIVALAIVSIVWHYSRSKSLVEQWAHNNGYRLIQANYAHFSKGPFFWTTSKSQTVYRVTVEDRNGRRREGWVRCGSWWAGLWSDQTEVRWDDEP